MNDHLDHSSRLPASLLEKVRELRAAAELVVFLDYDGTLVPFANLPELAVPDPALLSMLARLADRPGTRVHLVSGRPYEFLEKCFGHLNLGLHAEHGYWSRAAPGGAWVMAGDRQSWKPLVSELLTRIAREVPGSFVEEKTASVAWHYRRADPDAARPGLLLALARLEVLGERHPIEILNGAMVLEVRRTGINKGLVVHAVLGEASSASVLSVGDDTTDQDLFSASPRHAVTVAVGDRPLEATHRVPSHREVRSILQLLLRRE